MLITERGVAQTTDTQNSRVPRNLHTRFHLHRFCGPSAKSFMAVTHAHRPTEPFFFLSNARYFVHIGSNLRSCPSDKFPCPCSEKRYMLMHIFRLLHIKQTNKQTKKTAIYELQSVTKDYNAEYFYFGCRFSEGIKDCLQKSARPFQVELCLYITHTAHSRLRCTIPTIQQFFSIQFSPYC